ncbi:hypothetical protein J1605_001869 [Eschrichtius robustus]|uniref:Uncharacterized protein n=1 Tax=Eschrichtius robustus TaxID=9764 RepID=A0AB34I383_ESCRO|nr:hypothetical protein J1605_001869 [Eschrichtius robustus]
MPAALRKMSAPRAATQPLSLHVLARGSPSNSVPRAADSSRRPRGLGRPRAAAVEAWPPRLDHLGAGAAAAAAFLPTNVHSAAGRAPPAGLCNSGQPPPAAHAHFPPRMKRTPAPARFPAAAAAAAASRRTPGGLRAAQKAGTESPRKAGARSRTGALRTRRMRRGVSRSGPSQITERRRRLEESLGRGRQPTAVSARGEAQAAAAAAAAVAAAALGLR